MNSEYHYSTRRFCVKEVFLASSLFDVLEDCSLRSTDLQTPVHVAAAWGRENILQLLLVNGGNPWLTDVDDNNAFHYAYQEQHWNIVQILQNFRSRDSFEEEEEEEDGSDKFKFTFEKVFLYNNAMAYEYVVKLQTEMNCKARSVATQTCNSRDIISSTLNSGPDSHLKPDAKEKSQSNYEIFSNVVSGSCEEKKTQNVNSIVQPVLETEPNNNCTIAKNQIPNISQELHKENTDVENEIFSTSVGLNSKSELIGELKNCSCSKNVTRDASFLKSSLIEELKSVQKQRLSARSSCNVGFEAKDACSCDNNELSKPAPNTVMGKLNSLNINSEKSLLPLTSDKDSKTDAHETVGMQTMKNEVGDDSDKNMLGEKRRISIIDKYTAMRSSLKNPPVAKSDILLLKDYDMENNCINSTNIRSNGTDLKTKPDRTDVDCENSSYEDSALDSWHLSLITEDEFIASQSCSLISLDSDFFTCRDASPVSSTRDVPRKEDKNVNKNINEIHGDQGVTQKQNLNGTVSSSSDTYVSLSEEYKYSDEENGVVLLERRFIVPPVSVSDLHCDDKADSKIGPPLMSSTTLEDGVSDKGHSSPSDTSVPSSLDYDTDTLREKLKDRGYIPGPITPTTKRLYLKKLIKLQKKPVRLSLKSRVYSSELQRTLQNFDWQKKLVDYLALEKEVANQFSKPEASRRWREGVVKSSFTYLLLDPRITDNLPCRTDILTQSEIWSTFLSSIFYVGKGKRSRPYSHLYQAYSVWKNKTTKIMDKKVHYIIDIWNADMGVVCLHVFQNVIPVEAYTREAAMIDAIGLHNLKNMKSGEYYGVAATWTSHQKKMLGTFLLYRAMCIFFYEGERQLRPGDIG
ncbi:uncharacterized protein [Periplaneta americana]|uniref:uncharacterized protein isoform X2 n=1 Tax=Periplaneta americana TaxID=6978 RepID=UPI0037E7B09B